MNVIRIGTLRTPRSHRASLLSPSLWRGATIGVLALAGCASAPHTNPSEVDYQHYWACAYAAAMPHAADRRLSPREAAMRAQAECYTDYAAYRDARIDYVRSTVPARDREMATTLGTQAALERRKLVTRRLTELVAEAR